MHNKICNWKGLLLLWQNVENKTVEGRELGKTSEEVIVAV